ncbi:Cytochrome c oxidase subunit 4 [Mitosporidium daphniae]|uniref:Polypeptide IV of cytochrome c oxidase n=1 Tax=Mitosporidium daphniae TaxID=1485682 RepID=A0A098VTX4_9MICR|nr:polypeptide IV of cytochrome c oxidase [Mitosporidium daphniae]KGG51176.1 polypeptide IV of cytochrome c oxidase [Mitosporidium daphniae]|eukprot:XP_013237603.1 polypeptide IV of cytochrome c oxidase [Mitosporidium daphniae]
MFEIASAACMRHLARCGRHHGRLVSWRCLGSSSGAQNGEYRPIVGPGPSADRPYTDFDMSVGLERLEYLAKTHGINIFDNEWLPGDRFGTHGDPILVEATGDERIIGCTGAPRTSHETIWFNVAKGEIGRCVDCGQAFKVVDAIAIDIANYLPKAQLPSSDGELRALLDSLGIESSHVGKAASDQ